MSPERPEIANRVVRRRVAEGSPGADERDRIAVEAPLELRAEGEPRVVIMRTPGHDVELARGLLWAEGVLQSPEEGAAVAQVVAESLLPTEVGNVVEIGLSRALVDQRWPGRSLYASSACGVCGATSIAAIEERATPIRSDLRVPVSVVAELPETLRRSQEVFSETGGLHAAGLFDASGELLCVREDVGRHNAVDKIVGWALAGDLLPLSRHLLCVSGRLSFELVHKAIAAGIPLVAAVSAPSSLAIDLAERFRVTLCGFVRGGEINIYSHQAAVIA